MASRVRKNEAVPSAIDIDNRRAFDTHLRPFCERGAKRGADIDAESLPRDERLRVAAKRANEMPGVVGDNTHRAGGAVHEPLRGDVAVSSAASGFFGGE